MTGSKKALLYAEALSIFSNCLHNHIALEPEWIPREANEQADYISRIVDLDDWQLNPAVFTKVDREWGPHTIDRFADENNKQLDRFNSRYWSPGTEAVDAFSCNWRQEVNWLCPPVHLIPRAIQHVGRQQLKVP